MYEMKLYILGRGLNSQKAIDNLQAILESEFKGRYSLAIIDFLANSEFAEIDNTFATPTVVKSSPPPSKKILGDTGNKEKILAGLGMLEDVKVSNL